jgi:hypothetical protein
LPPRRGSRYGIADELAENGLGILEKLNAFAGIEEAPDDPLIKVVLMDLRMIWVWVPKNAGGSISRDLLRVHGEAAVACAAPLDLLWRLNPEFRRFEIVAFKRNPYTRVVSCWLNKVMAPYESNESYFRKFKGLKAGMAFADFADWLNSRHGSDERADRHWMSQQPMLKRADRLLPFEDLAQSVKALGLDPADLSHRNRHEEMSQKGGLQTRPLLDWYDERAFKAISTRYAGDLEALGYGWPGS